MRRKTYAKQTVTHSHPEMKFYCHFYFGALLKCVFRAIRADQSCLETARASNLLESFLPEFVKAKTQVRFDLFTRINPSLFLMRLFDLNV